MKKYLNKTCFQVNVRSVMALISMIVKQVLDYILCGIKIIYKLANSSGNLMQVT